MFERFFEKKPDKEVGSEPQNTVGPLPLEEQQKPEFKMEDFLVLRSQNRVIFHIPIAIFNEIGGRNTVTRDIFPALFDGSYPVWSENLGNEYVVEVPDDQEKIEEFKRRILARISR